MNIIPEKIILGKRQTGNQGYLVFSKPDGSIKNEVRFKKWVCEELGGKISNIENEALSGFSIISTVGGNGGYDKRQAYVQVKDPRGFVIEITDENFIEICKNFGVNKGVLDGEYVYAFDDKYASLCLVNVLDKVCGEYKQNTIEYYTPKTKEKVEHFSFKNLKPGMIYRAKYIYGYVLAMYLGKFNLYDEVCIDDSVQGVARKYIDKKRSTKSHLFVINSGKYYDRYKILALRNTNILSEYKNCPSYLNPNEFQDILNDVQAKCDEQIKSKRFKSFDYFVNGLDNNHPINKIKCDKNLFKLI